MIIGTIVVRSNIGSSNGVDTNANPNPTVALTVDARKMTNIKIIITFVSTNIFKIVSD
tara:strand:- start:454 stop:627 length:174 start_codon:yes stop_codon:yes gene_type:complete